MSLSISGVVRNGVVVPSNPLPEGTHVQIHPIVETDVPPDLQEELTAWQQASANALALVEKMAEEDEADETR